MKTDVECELFELGIQLEDIKAEAFKKENEIDAVKIRECNKVRDSIKATGEEIKAKMDLLTQENKPEIVEIYKYIYQVFQLLYEKNHDEAISCSHRITDRNQQIYILVGEGA